MSTFWCIGNIDMCIEFFERVKELEHDTLEERIKLLLEIRKKYEGTAAGVSSLSEKEFINHMGQHYKKILHIKKDE